jgi:L-rhamnono-1,4-lactonase
VKDIHANLQVDHMCKPDMRTPIEGVPGSARNPIQFLQWREGIHNLAKYPKAYMKLSGGFSELPPQSPENLWGPRQVVDRMKPFADVVFEAFGPQRIMFGSDWPVCNVGGGGNQNAWKNWQASIELLLEEMGLSDEDKSAVWSGTAAKAYNIND